MADGQVDHRDVVDTAGHEGPSAGIPTMTQIPAPGLPSMQQPQPWQLPNGNTAQPLHPWGPPHPGYPVAPYHIADQQRYGYGPPLHLPGPPQPPQSSPNQSGGPTSSGSGAGNTSAGEVGSPIDDGDDGDGSGAMRGGNRILKQTRRAEQNRQAQRAFRQRKELYIADLEKRSAEFDQLQAAWNASEGRRAEVEERARALAERALALDARERNLPLNVSQMSMQGPIPEDLPTMRHEIEALRAQLAQREEGSRSLRLALEEVSTENRLLRDQLKERGIHIKE